MKFDKSYFMGDFVKTPNPAGYSNYGNSPNEAESFETLVKNLILKVRIWPMDSILVVGCAYGYTVRLLNEFKIDAYGVDISKFAISKALPEIKDKVFLGDARNDKDFEKILEIAKINKFQVILDEDMLCCLSDNEAKIFCDNARKYGQKVIHYMDTSPQLAKWYNYHIIEDWKMLVNSSENERWFERPKWSEK